MELPDEDEEDLCKVWDMAMDRDVAGLLQEFKATDILVGVISRSRCPRLTEICVGILGNIACFPDTCATLSQNENLGHRAVLLLLLGDADPPTLLETSRLLLTCLSQKDVCSLWLQRIRQQTSVRSNLCFIMNSSTNTDLLEKVGELVETLFDLDEDMMKSWITAQPKQTEGDVENDLDVASYLLEAAKQLRSESPNGLEVYLHALQLLTTIDEGIQMFAASDGPGKAVWDFVSEVVWKDLCQADDLSVILQEQKSILVQALSVLQALYRCQHQWHSKPATSLPLIGTILRLLQYHGDATRDGDSGEEEKKDEHLQMLAETAAEFLADICLQLSKETVADLVREGYLTVKTCVAAAQSLAPNFQTSVSAFVSMLSEADPRLADETQRLFPSLRSCC
uniref:Serum amyloid A-like 1 n=1 Tax=Tetraodon nigroviridis TaxID=99883 RepID=H3CEW5_TETNG